MTNASNVKRGFTPDSNPKRGNAKMGNNIDINLCKSAKAKQECHSLPYTVLRVRNDQSKHVKCGFTSVSNPKSVKGGNRIGIYLSKRTKVKWSRGLPKYQLTKCQHLKCGFTPDSNAKRGKQKWITKLTCIYVKSAMPVSYRIILAFPGTEWPMAAILGVPLPLPALPKGVKRGNKGDICFT